MNLNNTLFRKGARSNKYEISAGWKEAVGEANLLRIRRYQV
jgi:hypothetical protein